jgi:hypothetical protein
MSSNVFLSAHPVILSAVKDLTAVHGCEIPSRCSGQAVCFAQDDRAGEPPS